MFFALMGDFDIHSPKLLVYKAQINLMSSFQHVVQKIKPILVTYRLFLRSYNESIPWLAITLVITLAIPLAITKL